MNLKLIIKQFNLNIKFLFKNKIRIILLFIPIVLAIFIPIVFIPLSEGFSIVLETATIVPCGIIFISTAFNIRNSTIWSNIKVTKSNKYNFYISIYILMIIASFIILFLVLFILSILSELKLLKTDWVSYNKEQKYFFWDNDIFIPILSTFELVTILFSISFFFSQILKSEKPYYMILFSITILNIVFGGTINSYFWSCHNTTEELYFIKFSPSLFPGWTYHISIFYPFYSPGQLLVSFGEKSLVNATDGSVIHGEWRNLNIFQWENTFNVEKGYLQMWKWNMVLLMPLIQTMFFSSFGILIYKLKK